MKSKLAASGAAPATRGADPMPALRSSHARPVRFVALTATLVAVALAALTGLTDAQAQPTGTSLAQIRAEIAQLMKRPTSIGVTQKLAKRPVGKLFIQMRCAAPICVEASKEYGNAARALGMRFKAIDAGATPDAIARAFNQAVAEKPDALVSGAIPPQLFQKQLQQLVKNGSKVILYATAPPNPRGVTAFFFPPKEFVKIGTLLARFVYADAGGKPTKAVYVQTPEFAALNFASDAFKREIKSLCSTCGIDVLNVQAAEIGRVIPGKVVSYLQAHPDTKYVLSQFGDLEIGIPQAIKAAGITGVKLISTQGSRVNMQYVKAGQEYANLISFLDVTYWQVLDAVARSLAGQKFTVPANPTQWITKSNLNFNPQLPPPFGVDYKAAFKKLWGT
jgi:ribose transport system substrate-binding protein